MNLTQKRLPYLKIAAALLAVAFVFAAGGCGVQQLSSLREFARPWQGEYRCEEARCGGEDMLPRLGGIVVTLGEEGIFTAEVRLRSKKSLRTGGSYVYDEGTGRLEFSLSYGGEVRRAVTCLQKGAFTLSARVCGKAVVLRFCAAV